MYVDIQGLYLISIQDGTIYISAITNDVTYFTQLVRYVTKDKILEVF